MKKRRTLLMLIFLFCCGSATWAMAAQYTVTTPDGSSHEVEAGDDFPFTVDGKLDCISQLIVSRQQVDWEEVESVTLEVGQTGYEYTITDIQSNYKAELKSSSGNLTVKTQRYTPNGSLEDFSGSWKVCVADDLGNVDTAARCKTGSGEGTVAMPDDIPCNAKFVRIEFDAESGYYAPVNQIRHVSAFLNNDTVTGLYDPITYKLVANTGGRGSVSLSPAGSSSSDGSASGSYELNTTVSLTASAESGYAFQKWKGEIGNASISESKSPTLTVSMTQDRSITAVFAVPCADEDGDGYHAPSYGTNCVAPAGSKGEDCDDSDKSINPGAPEICGDGIDQDCDGADTPCGLDTQDADGDGFSPYQGDCNDNDASIAPGMYDNASNAIDEDCYDGIKEAGYEALNVSISDTPANIKKQPAPPLLMFLVDDSGSMDWEYIVKGSEYISYPNSTYYLFTPPSGSQTTYGTSYTVGRNLSSSEYRKNWRIRWSGHNTIFFNGHASYTPWPYWEQVIQNMPPVQSSVSARLRTGEREYTGTGTSFPDTAFVAGYVHADMDYPRSNSLTGQSNYSSTSVNPATQNYIYSAMYHPGGSHTNYQIDLGAQYTTVSLVGGGTLSVPNAHYYTIDDVDGNGQYDSATEEIYLVTMPGRGRSKGSYALNYYKVDTVNTSGNVTRVDAVASSNVPQRVKPRRYYVNAQCSGTLCEITDQEELAYAVRQDFADWYSFYRRRMLTTKAAIGLTIYDMQGVSLGVMGINKKQPNIPLTYIQESGGTETLDFLKLVYNYRSSGGTPIISNFYYIGKYFQQGTSGDANYLRTAADPKVAEECQKTDSVFRQESCGGSCQRAYVLIMTDGYYNADTPPNLYDSQGRALNNVDGQAKYSAVFRDSKSKTLADYAMYFYDIDLDENLPNAVASKLYDDNNNQHINVFTVSFGVGGNYDPWRFQDCLPSVTSCSAPGQSSECPTISSLTTLSYANYIRAVNANQDATFRGQCPEWWPTGNGASAQYSLIDDMYHAAVNSRGQYLNASDPDELIRSMETIKSLVISQVGTAASVTVNTQEINSDSLLYQTTFRSNNWSGDVLARCLNSLGDVVACGRRDYLTACANVYNNAAAACQGDLLCLISAQAEQTKCNNEAPSASTGTDIKWQASSSRPDHGDRQIITATSSGEGVPFTWAGLPESMKLSLVMGTSTGTITINTYQDEHKTEYAQKVLNFLRGDTSNEGSGKDNKNYNYFHIRGGKFGDFLNAEATYFKSEKLGVEWVIVGGNDGMLHVFEANTGKEEFAFIPHAVYDRLPRLTAQNYGETAHQYYVDGNIAIRQFDDGTIVLIGGLGKGGKGWYGLNLSAAVAAKPNYATAAKNIVLWEYFAETGATLPEGGKDNLRHLGYSYSRPQIVASRDKSASYALVVGNGYESESRQAALFILGLNSSGNLAWVKTLETGVGTPGTDKAGEWNGLSTPALIYLMGDGKNDFAYAGDLLGNMWKFDLNASSRTDWSVYFQSASGTPQPLFQAKSLEGWRQPITMKPIISLACASRQKGYMVYFGTGRLHNGDEDFPDKSYQSVYGIWDWSAQWGTDSPRQKYLGSFEGYVGSGSIGQCESACSLDRTSCNSECETGDTDCQADCVEIFKNCNVNCNSSRTFSNIQNALGSSGKVTLLRQNQIWGGGINYTDEDEILEQRYGVQSFEAFDNIVRTMSARPIDWYKPRNPATDNKIRHVGWHYDLPMNGERVAVDMALSDYQLVFASVVPSGSPCEEEGGNTYYWAVDSCTGGRLDSPFFDANMDGKVNNKDYINIGTTDNPVYVAVSAIGIAGMGPAATIVPVKGGPDKIYLPTGNITTNPDATDIYGVGGGGEGVSGGGNIGRGMGLFDFWVDRKWK